MSHHYLPHWARCDDLFLSLFLSLSLQSDTPHPPFAQGLAPPPSLALLPCTALLRGTQVKTQLESCDVRRAERRKQTANQELRTQTDKSKRDVKRISASEGGREGGVGLAMDNSAQSLGGNGMFVFV